MTKQAKIAELSEKRRNARLPGYENLHEFHTGFYDCDYVGPWTKSGSNMDAAVMVVGQDWSSGDVLGRDPPDQFVARHGYDPSFPTNKNLDNLLEAHLHCERGACYLTNLFPFIKPGKASSPIAMRDLVRCAKEFTICEIEIVSPKHVIALGHRTFVALLNALGERSVPALSSAIGNPYRHRDKNVHCVAHTGALGTNNRGRDQVKADWARLGEFIRNPV
jgi:uracil-DNA glycosylase